MKLIFVLCLIGWLSLFSLGEILIFPGLMVNKSCDVEYKVNAGKCIRYNDCASESKRLCDLFEEIAYVCCENRFISHDHETDELRNSRSIETG